MVSISSSDYGHGFIPKASDRRNLDFSFKLAQSKGVLPKETTKPQKFWWPNGWWGNQGLTSRCVIFAFAKLAKDGPVTQKQLKITEELLWRWYKESQARDLWGPINRGDDGTTLDGAAKWFKVMGLIGDYYWGRTVQDLSLAVLTKGPVVIGIPWYDSMYKTNDKGFAVVKGGYDSAHGIVVNGVSMVEEYFRLPNSWGRKWGDRGYCKISFEHMETLLSPYWSEMCLATELKLAA